MFGLTFGALIRSYISEPPYLRFPPLECVSMSLDFANVLGRTRVNEGAWVTSV